MSRLCRSCCLSFSMVAAAAVLVAAAPANALAEETVTESPSGAPAVPETAPPPPSTGWVPQGSGTEASSGGPAPTRRGSSLGSGGVPDPPRSTAEAPSETSGSSGYYESESPTPSTFEEPTRTPPVGSVTGSVEPPAPKATAANVGVAAVGAATIVALPESPRGGNTSAAPTAKPASLTTESDQVSSGSGALLWLIAFAFGLLGVYAAWRLFDPGEPFWH